MTASKLPKPPLFSSSDINGFWALFADNLANMIMVSVLCTQVLHIPHEIVFGRVLPGLGVALIAGLGSYAYLAMRLATREARLDVTALPYGISTPIMFAYVFMIMKPAYDYGVATLHLPEAEAGLYAWKVGLGAAFIGGVIEALGALVGPFLKRHLPRAGMLGTLAGIALVWIATVPLAEVFEHPIIGFASLGIVFAGLVALYRLPFGVPAGLAAIVVGTAIGAVTGEATLSFEGIGFYPPLPYFADCLEGASIVLATPWVLAVVVPAEIYNFIETMNNVESAEAAGDRYPVGLCQLLDGAGTLVGSLFGSPFPTTVYIGHPGYKRMGARSGYALFVGLVFFIGSMFGLVAFLYKLIPVAAVAPMLVFIGMVITAQAFRATPERHGMAVALAMIPHCSNLLISKWTTCAKVFTGSPKNLFEEKTIVAFLQEGAHVLGHSALANGAIIIGLLWGSLAAFLLDGRPDKAGLVSLGCMALCGLGIIHSQEFGLQTGPIFWGYGILTLLCLILYWFRAKSAP